MRSEDSRHPTSHLKRGAVSTRINQEESSDDRQISSGNLRAVDGMMLIQGRMAFDASLRVPSEVDSAGLDILSETAHFTRTMVKASFVSRVRSLRCSGAAVCCQVLAGGCGSMSTGEITSDRSGATFDVFCSRFCRLSCARCCFSNSR